MRKAFLFVLAVSFFFDLVAQVTPVASPEQWIEEGRAAMEEEDYFKAVDIYTRIIEAAQASKGDEITPESKYFEARYYRAVCYFYLDEWEYAISDLDLFITGIPTFPQAYILKSIIYQKQLRFNDQLASLNNALSFLQEEEWPRIYRLRAAAYLGLEKLDSALIDLKRGLSVEENAEGVALLGYIYYKKGDYDSAMFNYNKAIGLDFTFVATYQYAASYCLEQNQNDKAMTYITLGLLAEPETPELIFLKGVVFQEWGRTDEACSLFNRAFYAGIDDAGDYLSEYCYPIER
ncbi:MAG: hypothetical protein FJZ78_07610 [Bacteroidetes bacterium]|nr:hypothetical protein [Bacteroidota bacterium]